nr:hypothetical protein [Tanacetum cinerariifolium]
MENEENVQRILRTTSTPGKANVRCYNCNGKGHYTRDYPKPRVRDAKYFREQMLLAAKYEAGVNRDTEENDFMLINVYGDDQLEQLNASVIMMACIQHTNNKSDAELTYDAEVISEPYYVTHPSFMHDYDNDDYQGDIQGNGFAQKTMENEENVQRILRTTSTPGKANV